MRVKLLTLRFAPSLGGFDDRPLAEFVWDKEVLAASFDKPGPSLH